MSHGVKVGDLVRFVEIETGVDTLCAHGTTEIDPISRLFRAVCRTTDQDVGTVVAGPFPYNDIVVWLVLVGGDTWYFEGGHLVAVKSS